MNIFESDAYRTHMLELGSKLNEDQKRALNDIDNINKLTITFPTGTGKSLIMYADMLKHFKEETLDVFAVISHRLMLNTQHLTDMILEFKSLINHIGFIYVGSSKFDDSKFLKEEKYKEIRQLLLKNNVNFKDLILSTTSSREIKDAIELHKSKNRDIVIVSTYHSLDRLKDIKIHTLYCDEAHLLASDKTTDFINNYKTITTDRQYFFTATCKDSFDEETEAFLMNNKNIFGDKCNLKFKDAVEKGYIVKPIIHFAKPSNYEVNKNFGGDEKSVNNYCRFIKETFEKHEIWLENVTADKSVIKSKILVKCPDVDTMWSIYDNLVKDLKGTVRVFAGASRNDDGDVHQDDGIGVDNRDDYLDTIKNLKDNEKAIILHVDIFSEGISVNGLTGVMFLTQTLPTLPKILQNIGRSTRLNKFDRDKLKENKISTNDYSTWIKPHCAVILPFWDSESEKAVNEISKKIKELRDKFGFDPKYYVSEGDDMIKVKSKDDQQNLNKVSKRKKFDIIDKINQEIERLDNEDDINIFNKKLYKLTTDEEKLLLLDKELGL